MYLILLFLGLSIGAVFLVVLLIGDKREARLEAQRKALQEQKAAAGGAAEGAWPPPPGTPASSQEPPAGPVKRPDLAPGTSREMVRKFSLFRNCAIATVLVAYIVYSCFPRLPFGWVLLVTALLAAVLMAVFIKRPKPRP